MELCNFYNKPFPSRIIQDPEYAFEIKRGNKYFDKIVIDSVLGCRQLCKLSKLTSCKTLQFNFAGCKNPYLLLERLKRFSKNVNNYSFHGLRRLRHKALFKRVISNNINRIDCEMHEIPVRWILIAHKILNRLDLFFTPQNNNQYHSILLRILNFFNLNKKSNAVYINIRGLTFDKQFMDKFNNPRLYTNSRSKFLWDLSRWPPKTFSPFPNFDLLDFYCSYAGVSPDYAKLEYMNNIRNMTIERSGLVDPSQELKYFNIVPRFDKIIKFTLSLTGSTAKDIFSMLRFPRSIQYLEMNITETSRIDYKMEYDVEDLRDNNDMKIRACEAIETREHFVHLMNEVKNLNALKEFTCRIDCFVDHHVCYILFYYALLKRFGPLRLIHLDLTYKENPNISNLCDFNVAVFLHLLPNLEQLRQLCIKVPNMSFQEIQNRREMPKLEHLNIRSNMSQNRESIHASQQFFRDLAYSKIRYLHGYPLVHESFLDIIARRDSFKILKKLTFYPVANLSIDPDSIENLIKGLQSKKFLRILILSASETSLSDQDEFNFNELLRNLSHLRSVHMSLGEKNLIKN